MLFALLVFGLVAWGISAGWALFSLPDSGASGSDMPLNEAALGDDTVDVVSADLYVRLVPPSFGEEERALTFELTDADLFYRNTTDDVTVTRACLDVTFSTTPPVAGLTDEEANTYTLEYFTEDLDGFCAETGREDFFSRLDLGGVEVEDVYAVRVLPPAGRAEFVPGNITLADRKNVSINFWYPFDSITIEPIMQVTYYLYDNDDLIYFDTINARWNWDYVTTGSRLWDIQLTTEALDLPLELNADDNSPYFSGGASQVRLEMNRPLLFRVAFPFFMIGMILLISLIPLTGDRDTLVDITAALLFGIFGLKGIIGPSEALGQTILDVGFISLYLVLAFATLLFFINKLRLRGKVPHQESS
jgi:hypothetical protein